MFLGIDLGSSSVKCSLLNGAEGRVIATQTYPEQEMPIHSPHPGWAEQHPEEWWNNFLKACSLLFQKNDIDPRQVRAIGISYQMHGLVLVDERQQVLRPSIIWCDSRAVDTGRKALEKLGKEYCQRHLLNAPGNFTAAKLGWVRDNEPDIFARIHKFMLPGDYLAMKLTGKITTTETGLSEGIFWDFRDRSVSERVLQVFDISAEWIPEIVPAIGAELFVSPEAAQALGLAEETVISYRSGDQPNNAFSLNVLQPGEVAATAGTSGVIYAVTDTLFADEHSRINTFMHVNDSAEKNRNGVLVCINGTGILYSWLRKLLNTGDDSVSYEMMNEFAGSANLGAEGLLALPFGNGAERILHNENMGAHFKNLDLNRHTSAHMLRASLEGIVFAMKLGMDALNDLQTKPQSIRAGYANLFLSETFREIFVNVTGLPLELFDTDGAAGAARGAALGSGFYDSVSEAFESLKQITRIDPEPPKIRSYQRLYETWMAALGSLLPFPLSPKSLNTPS